MVLLLLNVVWVVPSACVVVTVVWDVVWVVPSASWLTVVVVVSVTVWVVGAGLAVVVPDAGLAVGDRDREGTRAGFFAGEFGIAFKASFPDQFDAPSYLILLQEWLGASASALIRLKAANNICIC